VKITALDSFACSELGMVHAGEEFDATKISAARLAEWEKRGFIPRRKKALAPRNKAERAAPSNKAD
jgi:hypothetical protein